MAPKEYNCINLIIWELKNSVYVNFKKFLFLLFGRIMISVSEIFLWDLR